MFYEKFPPFNVSGSARPYYFAMHLPEFGYAPSIVSSRLPPFEVPDYDLLAKLPGEVIVRRMPLLLEPVSRAVQNVLTKMGRQKKPISTGKPRAEGGTNGSTTSDLSLSSVIGGLRWLTYYWVDWSVPAFVGGLRDALDRADVIWVTAPHFRNVVPAYLLSRFSGKPLVVDLRDPWTYGSLWQPATAQVARWERQLAEKVLAHASRIVVTSPLTAAEFTKRFPECPADKMVTITNGYAANAITPDRRGHEGKLLLRYIGMLNERRKPDALLAALSEALQDDGLAADLRFEFIGSMGPHAHKLTSPELKGAVTSLGKVPYDQSIGLMRGCDVNVLLQTIEEGQDVIAGKTFEYLAANRPILAAVDTRGGDAWLLRETGAGLIVDWKDTAGIAAAIRELWQLWKQGRLQERFSQADLSAFSRQNLAQKLSRVLDDVIAEGSRSPSVSAGV